ncbi:MAG: FliG C-terminal domain-containing protein [Hasllibacter sp.]
MTVPAPHALAGPDRAALVVRLALDKGVELPLNGLPAPLQERLADRLSRLGTVERDMIETSVALFGEQLDRLGAAFTPGMEGALTLLQGHADPALVDRLRRATGAPPAADPWEALAGLPPARLTEALSREHPATAALALTRLPVPLASRVLSDMPGPDARRIAAAVRTAGDVPERLATEIGEALAGALVTDTRDEEAPRRVAEILDAGTLQTRTDVLTGLDEVDTAFAAAVRAVSFGFVDIPDRVEARDVPIVLRDVPQEDQIAALGAALSGEERLAAVAEFILTALPSRLADRLREGAAEAGSDTEAGEAGMRAIALAAKAAEAAGEIRLLPA